MAECSYARCLQQRRYIKRELMRWSKDMVYVVGLERVAEELMGRRKWKILQEVFSRSQINISQEQTNIEKLEPSIVENYSKSIKEENQSINCSTKDNNQIENKEEFKERKLTKEEYSSADNHIENPKTTTKEEIQNSTLTNNPVDWKPADRCYFCVDGKLLTVNEKGEIVAESGPALSEAELANKSANDSDSDSRNSTPDIIPSNQSFLNVKKLVTSHQIDSQIPPNMTSFESVAVRLAAIQGLQSPLGQLYPNLWYQQIAQQLPTLPPTSEQLAAASSPSNKDSPSPNETGNVVSNLVVGSVTGTGEQPLDLSSKPSPSSSVSGDSKQAFKVKPRINTTIPGRRTYTEEELQSALHDIMSGKLGTRRAAVQYGIPRSTLRNKIYKIALEQKRDTSTSLNPAALDALDADDDDKDISDEDERDLKLADNSALITTQPEDISTSHLLQTLRKPKTADLKPSAAENQTKHKTLPTTPTQQPQSQTPPIAPNRWLDSNVLLQSLLFQSSLGALVQPHVQQQPQQSPLMDDPVVLREILSRLLIQQEEIIKEQQLKSSSSASTATTSDSNRGDHLNNGKQNILTDTTSSVQQTHAHQQQLLQHLQSGQRLSKSETPETASSADYSENNEEVILRIPSFKPVTPTNKNGDGSLSPTPSTSGPVLPKSPQNSMMPGGITSPPPLRQSSESQSPPLFSLRDVIANSISRTFGQQKDQNLPGKHHYDAMNNSSSKRGNISVIKSIGGTDLSHFAAQPNLLNSFHHHHHHSSAAAAAAAAAAAGKGTRPKRGKYRNYDRDSLVEAVKAVQRGEMSVHRAGSYYGVPHSTLEYKVKERHLMRPRKREPKPQPIEGGGSNTTNSTSLNQKHSNLSNISAVNSLDKLKIQQQQHKAGTSSLKNSPPFPSTSPNGMKMPGIFDPAMTAAQLQYAPHLFWPHGFNTLPLDFQRQALAAATGSSSATTNSGSGTPAENFITSQMIQRFQEESNRFNSSANQQTKSNTTELSPSNITTNVINKTSVVPNKSARELAESLYDGGEANGSSFLDGIIRQTLDRKNSSDLQPPPPHGTLLDHLVKNQPVSKLTNSNSNDSINFNKRSASPTNNYPVIKRERSSSPATLVPSSPKKSNSSELTTTIYHNSIDSNIGCGSSNVDQHSEVEQIELRKNKISIKLENEQEQHHSTLHQRLVSPTNQSSQKIGDIINCNNAAAGGSNNSSNINSNSILHEKLGKIKSENHEDNL